MDNLVTTDPKVFGPGMWMTLHILAFNSNTLRQSHNFLFTLRPIIEKIPCKECRLHALSFINKTNYDKYKNIKNKEGLYVGAFIYVCDMHNNANIWLKKDAVRWQTAYAAYDNMELLCKDGPCTQSSNSNYNNMNNLSNSSNDDNLEQIKYNIIKSVNPKKIQTKIVFTKNGKLYK